MQLHIAIDLLLGQLDVGLQALLLLEVHESGESCHGVGPVGEALVEHILLGHRIRHEVADGEVGESRDAFEEGAHLGIDLGGGDVGNRIRRSVQAVGKKGRYRVQLSNAQDTRLAGVVDLTVGDEGGEEVDDAEALHHEEVIRIQLEGHLQESRDRREVFDLEDGRAFPQLVDEELVAIESVVNAFR